jgi:hypothetical protein
MTPYVHNTETNISFLNRPFYTNLLN